MVFIDDLAFGLFSIGFAGMLLFYTIASMYLVYRNKKKDYHDHLKAAHVPMMLVGLYMVVLGFFGQATWPLPGSYNILFFDPLVAFGLVVLAFALSIRYNVRLEYAGFLGLMVGAMVIVYGVQGYAIGLTSEPIALLGMYGCFGIAGLFSYPVAMIADRLPGLQKRPWLGWHVMLLIFGVFLLLASLLSFYVGASAVAGHLVTAP